MMLISFVYANYVRWRTRKRHNSAAVVSEATNKFIERVLAWRLPDRARLDGPEGDEGPRESSMRPSRRNWRQQRHRWCWRRSRRGETCSKVNCTWVRRDEREREGGATQVEEGQKEATERKGENTIKSKWEERRKDIDFSQ